MYKSQVQLHCNVTLHKPLSPGSRPTEVQDGASRQGCGIPSHRSMPPDNDIYSLKLYACIVYQNCFVLRKKLKYSKLGEGKSY
jgi:hypothetical protein